MSAGTLNTPEQSSIEVVDELQFGSLLKSKRIEAQIRRQEDLAKKFLDVYGVKVAKSTISKYEQGRTIPPLEYLLMFVAICKPTDGMAFYHNAVREDIRRDVFGE